LFSYAAKVRKDRLYRFSIRARVKRNTGQNAFVNDIFAGFQQSNGGYALESIGHNIKSTNGKWVEYSGTFQSNKDAYPRIGFYIEFEINRGGIIDFDCARIERVN